jgi:sirohydrochlorin ferrochelatase
MGVAMPSACRPNPPPPTEKVGIIIVDHGSQRDESNQLLLDVAAGFRATSRWHIVEPAHMELAEPSIAAAFARCVEQGARLVVVFPYFLGPGRHWHEDIPRLAAAAAQAHPGVLHQVAAPFGLHPLLNAVIEERIDACLAGTKDASVRVPTDEHG